MMSLRQLESFQAQLKLNLKEAGLPTDPRQVIGKLYEFECEHGSHHEILVGTVRAIGISDTGGLNLYVSSPYFFGGPLTSIMYNNGKWMAYVVSKPLSNDEKERAKFMADGQYEASIEERIASQFFFGEFRLL